MYLKASWHLQAPMVAHKTIAVGGQAGSGRGHRTSRLCEQQLVQEKMSQGPVQEVRQISLLTVKHSLLDAMLFEQGHLSQ